MIVLNLEPFFPLPLTKSRLQKTGSRVTLEATVKHTVSVSSLKLLLNNQVKRSRKGNRQLRRNPYFAVMDLGPRGQTDSCVTDVYGDVMT